MSDRATQEFYDRLFEVLGHFKQIELSVQALSEKPVEIPELVDDLGRIGGIVRRWSLYFEAQERLARKKEGKRADE